MCREKVLDFGGGQNGKSPDSDIRRAILLPKMLTTAVVEDNKASWLRVLISWTNFQTTKVGHRGKPVIEACIKAGLDQYFRAGQSMQHIIFAGLWRSK